MVVVSTSSSSSSSKSSSPAALFCVPCLPSPPPPPPPPATIINYQQALRPTIRISLVSAIVLFTAGTCASNNNNNNNNNNNLYNDHDGNTTNTYAAWTIVIWMMITTVTLFWTCPPIPQPQWYHDLADQRPTCLLFGGSSCCGRQKKKKLQVPNGNDVLSNIPFAIVSIVGLLQLYYDYFYDKNDIVLADPDKERPLWTAYYIGVGMVSIGSSYYHFQPNNARLAWDRFPMTIAFCSLVAVVIQETIMDVTMTMLCTMIVCGASTVLYWHMVDDLRPYALVQAFSLASIPLCHIIIRSGGSSSRYYQDDLQHYIMALGFYILAKMAEDKDNEIFVWTKQLISGHTLKHLLSGIAAGWAMVILSCRSLKMS